MGSPLRTGFLSFAISSIWFERGTNWDFSCIKEIFINGVSKDFTPIWIDSSDEIEDDPYQSDCGGSTNASNPHAYTKFSITSGAMTSKTCIEKPPGILDCESRNKIQNARRSPSALLTSYLSLFVVGVIFWLQCNLWRWRKDKRKKMYRWNLLTSPTSRPYPSW